MDFHSILNIAQKTQAINEKKKLSGLNTKFTAPKKEQKTKEKTSEAIKKLLEEKEKDKHSTKEKARKHKKRESEKSTEGRGSKGESFKNKVDVKLEIPLEEVVIHKEDFVKSSSKRRQAHNPGFVNRPVIAPIIDEPVIKEERVNKVKQQSVSTDTSSKHSSDKHRISSKSTSNSSSTSTSSSKHSSKPHKSSRDPSTSSSKPHKSSTDSSTSSSKIHKSSRDLSTSSSKHFSKSSLVAHRHDSSSSNREKSLSRNDINGVSKRDSSSNRAQKPKHRPPAPPPMDFGALLKLAEQKHKEVPQVEIVKKPVKKEPETSLLTQDEKDRLERTKSKTYKEWLKHGTTSTTPESLTKKAINQRQKNDYTKLKLNPDAVKRKLCSDERKDNIKAVKIAKLDLARNETKSHNRENTPRVNLKEKFRTKSAGSSGDISRSDGAGSNRNDARMTSKVNLKEKFRTTSAGSSNGAIRSLSQQSHKTNGASKVNTSERFGSIKNAVGSQPSMPSNIHRPAPKLSTSEKNRSQRPTPKLSNSEMNRSQRPASKLPNSEKNRPQGHAPKLSNLEKYRPQTSLQKTKSDSGLDRRKAPTMLERPRPSSMGKKERRPSSHYSTTNENVLVCGPTKKEETVHVNPFDRIYGQIQKNRPTAKRPLDEDLDSEEEDWSDEDDDFIDDDFVDDAPIGPDNYSSHLKDVFGYSYKDRFRNFDDRDTNMVSSFAQQMKEEARSTRLGKLEDLEDMQQELEEIQKKKNAKKKKRS